jgi:hypothetical protein
LTGGENRDNRTGRLAYPPVSAGEKETIYTETSIGNPRCQQVLKDSEKIGAVMIVGAGIAGIQASLDLANSGLKVFLVEKGNQHRRRDGPARQDLPHQ